MACRPGRSLWIESSSSAELTHTGVAWAYVHGSSGEPVSRSRPALRWSSSGRTRAQFPVGRPYTSGWLAPRGARRGSGHSAPPVRVAARAGDPRISRTPLARCGRSGSPPRLCLSGCNGERGKRSGAYRQVADEETRPEPGRIRSASIVAGDTGTTSAAAPAPSTKYDSEPTSSFSARTLRLGVSYAVSSSDRRS